MELSHVDGQGQARMVDVSRKEATEREARARGSIRLSAEAFAAVRDNTAVKGDVLTTARLAGIMAAKKTPQLIPLTHPLPLSSVSLDFEADEASLTLRVTATVKTVAVTGVEMEALCAASVALLTVYDMVKAIDKSMEIGPLYLIYKSGGKSGTYRAD